MTPVITHIVEDKSTFKESVFSERDQDRDTEKEQALNVTFSQSDWFIPKMSVSVTTSIASTRRNSHHNNSESIEATVKLNVYSRKYNFNCSVTANVQAEL